MSVNILVVDDSAAMRAMICSVIQSIGLEAIPVASGEEACEVFQQTKIDIAVLDVNLEGIDGFETCRRLRKLAENDWFPVIYLSATDSVESIVEGLDAGGDAYVTKPVNPRVLEAILNAMGRIADMKKALDEANQKLERLATYDSLTRIPNRRSFDESLIRCTLQAKREKHELALLLIDIDHFKLYNDHYGHAQGDDCLVSFAQVLTQSLLRPVDVVARYGGEEFGMVLPNTSREGAENVCQRIMENLQTLAKPHAASPTAAYLTASIGIAFSSFGSLSPDALINAADKALYRAKDLGRNQCSVNELSAPTP